MRAKEQWLAGNVPAARSVLEQAHSNNPDSEEVILAAFKLEFENNEPERARLIAKRAMNSLSEPSARVWMKAAMVARELRDDEVCYMPWVSPMTASLVNANFSRVPLLEVHHHSRAQETSHTCPRGHMWQPVLQHACRCTQSVPRRDGSRACMQEQRQVLQEGMTRFSDAPKLHMMLAQLEEKSGDIPAARKALQKGLKHSPKCVPMWTMLARLEEKHASVPAARAMLEQARLRNPKCSELWRAAVRTESRAGNSAAASTTLTRALQDCAGTAGVGKLWALHVSMAERTQRKAKMEDALRKAGDSPHMFAAVGQKFLEDRRYEKARKYFHRATVLDEDIGDFWGMLVACEQAAGRPDAAAQAVSDAKKVRPHHCRDAAVVPMLFESQRANEVIWSVQRDKMTAWAAGSLAYRLCHRV
jgi:Tfp pilus assembly protein PilF